MTETVEIEVGRETFEKIAAQAESTGVSPAEALELDYKRMTPDRVPQLENYLSQCSECNVWSRPPNCWRCGASLDRDVGRDD